MSTVELPNVMNSFYYIFFFFNIYNNNKINEFMNTGNKSNSSLKRN